MIPLAQPPRKDDRSFDDWMHRMWKRISDTAGIAWSLIDKTGSNLTDLTTRNHADLQNINTATYTHLSATNHTDLTDGGTTTLHQHDFNYVPYPTSLQIGAPTHIDTLQEIHNHSFSAGVMDGCDITDNGNGTVSFASGHAMLRPSADSHTSLYAIAVSAQTNLALTDDATNYVYLDYNAGSPQFVASTSITSFNCMDKCIAYMVHRNGNTLHTIDAREQNVDSNRKSRQLYLKFSRFIHSENGTVIGSSGLAITVTAGSFWFMMQEQAHDAFDTSVAGTANVNVFKLWYRDGVGGYTGTASQKTITTTTYDSGTGTPATLSNNKFGVTWFYIVNDSPSELHAVMGQAEYASFADARVASPPTAIPSIISGIGSLIGFVIYEKSNTVFDSVESAFNVVFSHSAPTNHEGLSGLLGGAASDHYHLTGTQATDLTDAGDSTLHYHATDRALGNATGTLALGNGGTGQTTAQLAMNALAGAVTSGSYLRGNGTNVVMATIQAADVPTLNQNTTGTASNVTGTVAIANGGTGQTTATAAFDALAPTTTQGDIIYHNGTDNVRLAKGTASQVLTMNAGATAPEWATPSAGSGSITLGTPVNTTSGTSIDFTGLPSGIQRITIFFDAISTNGSSNLIIQIGDGSVNTTGYNSVATTLSSAASSTAFTTGFGITQSNGSTNTQDGFMILANMGSNKWKMIAGGEVSGYAQQTFSSGMKTLTGTLDRVRLTTVNGTDSFDAGVVNIAYE